MATILLFLRALALPDPFLMNLPANVIRGKTAVKSWRFQAEIFLEDAQKQAVRLEIGLAKGE